MPEEFQFKRRNRLKRHYVNTSNVLLYGYQEVAYEEKGSKKSFRLSDAAKITYQVIDGFDWEDKETKDSKGFVYPSIDTLVKIRGLSRRTIFDHINQLEKAKLLFRVPHKYKPSDLYIEEISDEEIAKYEKKFLTKETEQPSVAQIVKTEQKTTRATLEKSRSAKNCIPQEAGGVQKSALVYNEEKEKKEKEINVNEFLQKFSDGKTETTTRKRSGMHGLSDILKRIDTLKPPPERKQQTHRKIYAKLTPDEKAKRDYFANEIATELQDEKSLGCYRTIADKVPQQIIFEMLGSVKETWKEGKIKKSRGALFVDLIKNYCDKRHIDLQFATP